MIINNKPLLGYVLGQSLIETDPRHYFDLPLQGIQRLLSSADFVTTNFEGSISSDFSRAQRTRFDQYFHGTDTQVLDYLSEIGVNLLSYANNHAWDLGDKGVHDMMIEADARHMTWVGIGVDRDMARRPSFRQVQGMSIGLTAAVTLDTTEDAPATNQKPGYFRVEKGSQADLELVLESVQSAASTADFVLFHHHFHHHPHDEDNIEWQQQFAREAIQAGATVYIGSGEPVMKGIEIYRGKPILYGLGNFVFHTRAPIGQYPRSVWEAAICQIELKDAGIKSLRLIPVVVDEGEEGEHFLEKRGFPSLANEESGQSILDQMRMLSKRFGTTIDEAGEIELK